MTCTSLPEGGIITAHPNVVLIVVDDLGWRDLACTGSDFYETPRIDQFAATSAVCTQAYAPAPNCSPSRASLLTGRLPARIGVTQIMANHHVGRRGDVRSHAFLPRQEYTLARALRAAGYRTWHVGKWHLGPRHSWPDRHGFERNIGGSEWGHPPSYFSPYGCPTLTDGPAGEYLTDRLTDEAVALLTEHACAEGSGPFFLNLWHYAVHTPIEAPAGLVEKYRRKAEELGLTDDAVTAGEEMPYWHEGEQRVHRRTRQGHPGYAAMIENLDANIGRLLDALEELGLAEDTVVVLTSDNGGLHTGEDAPTSNLPLAEGKGWLSEGGLRVPLIVRLPGSTHGCTVGTPITLTDLFPTVLSWCGVSLDPAVARGIELDGDDMSGQFGATPEPDTDRTLFWHFPHYANVGATPASAVRHGRWKLVRSYEEDRDRLFDLAADDAETTDVGGAEPEVLATMVSLLEERMMATGALTPPLNPHEPFDEFAPAVSGPSTQGRENAARETSYFA